jgi:ABC-type transport system substrate-binding protein
MAAARAVKDTESLRQLLSLAATLANLSGAYEKANEYLEEAARLGSAVEGAERREEIPRGGKLVVALANPADAIEPAGIYTLEEEEILCNAFETLLATDAEGHLVPNLSESWEVKTDGRALILTLRHDVHFHDGHLLTAEDVRASFERSMRRLSQEMPAAFAAIRGCREFMDEKAARVEGIVVHSDRNLEVQLEEALPIYPAFLTQIQRAITRAVPDAEEADGRVLGTGPYRIVAHHRDRVLLERNPDYWKEGLPALDAIEFRPSLTATAIARGFRSGEIELARDLLPQDLEQILRDPRHRRGVVEASTKNTYFVLFNCQSGPTAQNPALRRALAGMVPARDIVWQTLGRFAQRASCLIPPGMLGHDPGRRSHTVSREEALQMLSASAVDSPIRLKASVHPLFQDRYRSLLEALMATWSELGVEVSVETSDMDTFIRSWQENEGLDLMIARWNADYDDPDNFTHTLFHSRTGSLRRYFSSAESDQILEEARSESRPAVRESLYRKFESLLVESGALIPLFHDIDYRLASPKVLGLKLRGTSPYVNYSELAISETAEAETEAGLTGGGVVHIPIAGVVNTFDPALAGTVELDEVLTSVFETLTRDAGGARIVPWLASELKVEEGGRRYRFRLRDDVRFHDGRKLTARDVRYSFERLLQSSASDTRAFFSPVRGARAILSGEATQLAGFRIQSATEFTIELEEPVAFFPALISYQSTSILPEGSDPSGAQGWVGTGPFRVVAFEPGRRLELERNKTYWRKGYPRSEGLVFSFGVSAEDILSGFRAGRFALAWDLFPADVEALRREPEFASGYRETPRLITYFAAFNTHQGPFADRTLRQRLAQAVDVSRIVRQTLGRVAIPAVSLIPPGLLSHERTVVPRAEPMPPGASEEMPTAMQLTAAVHPLFFGPYAALARELWNAFAGKGVRIQPRTQTMDDLLEALRKASVDLAVSRWGGDYPDADTFAHILHSREGYLGRLCGSSEIDRLIERGRAETSPAVRHSLYRQIEEILAREAILVPLFHEQAYRFARPEVEGLTISIGIPTVAYENLHIRG